MSRPTPETDAVIAADRGDSGFIRDLCELSRNLERERDEARESLEFQTKLNRELIEREKQTCKERDELRAEVERLKANLGSIFDARKWHREAQMVNSEEAGAASRKLINAIDAAMKGDK